MSRMTPYAGHLASPIPRGHRIDQLLVAAAREAGDAPAIEDASGHKLRYSELLAQSEAVAEALRGFGAAMDEPVLLSVANRTTDLVNFLGIWRAGCVAVPVHHNSSATTVRHICSITCARILIHTSDVAPTASFARFAYAGTCTAQSDFAICESSPSTSAALRDAALVVFTSGTTGVPKGVVQSHRRYCDRLRAVHDIYGMPPGLRTQLYLQLTFSFGQWTSLYTLARGGLVCLHAHFNSSEAINLLKSEGVDWFPAVPSLLRKLASTVLATNERLALLGKVGLFLAGGEVLREEDVRLVREAFPRCAITDVYGLTETNSADFIVHPDRMDSELGSIGRPSPGVSYRIAPLNQPCPGMPLAGELQILTPFIMQGYLEAEETTCAAFDGEYFRTGDLAELLPDGCVRIVGRVKELINRSGNKVAPAELEQLLLQHPDVQQVLVGGVADADKGERIVAVVVCGDRTPQTNELVDWLRQRVEKYKVPDILVLAEALPLGTTGKRDRKALAAMILSPA